MGAELELTQDQKDFLRQCEEELKDRFTEKDENYMNVYNRDLCPPPIIDPWHAPNLNRRNNQNFQRRNNRRDHPYNNYSDRRGTGGYHDRRGGARDYQQQGDPYQRRDRRPY